MGNVSLKVLEFFVQKRVRTLSYIFTKMVNKTCDFIILAKKVNFSLQMANVEE